MDRNMDGVYFRVKRDGKWQKGEPMDDLISRQAAIDKAITIPIAKIVTEDKVIYRKAVFVEDIEALPSAERHGRWIMHINDLFPAESTMECDQCHEEQPLECDDKYCPNCGAIMDEVTEE